MLRTGKAGNMEFLPSIEGPTELSNYAYISSKPKTYSTEPYPP